MEQNENERVETLKDELVKKVMLAADVAKATPEFGERAFDKVLEHLLHQAEDQSRRGPRSRAPVRDSRGSRRAPKTDASALERVRPILDGAPELIAEYADLMNLPVKAQIYGLLSIARERFHLDGLTLPELRAVANDKFRIGIRQGTLSGTLSGASATEIGRAGGPGGETTYRLLQPGEAYLGAARTRLVRQEDRSAEVIP